jgi:hypothetical protein
MELFAFRLIPQVPFEQLKKSNRKAQKFTEKELVSLQSAIADLGKGKLGNPTDTIKSLDALIERMSKLRRKVIRSISAFILVICILNYLRC